MKYEIIEGDLIALALEGRFDVIVHGCNCFCSQKAGIAKKMAETFKTDSFPLENSSYKGRFSKLGNIDHARYLKSPEVSYTVVNAYTQFHPGPNLDYDALALCLKKINEEFKGEHIGLPKIGCGIAGGDWKYVDLMIREHLIDCDVTVVELPSVKSKDLTFTADSFKEFQIQYQNASTANLQSFMFDGQEFVTTFAKYLIEYFNSKF